LKTPAAICRGTFAALLVLPELSVRSANSSLWQACTSVSGGHGSCGEAPSDDFRHIDNLQVVPLGVIGGVLKHDGTVRAGDSHCRGMSFDELAKAEFIHSLARVLTLVVSDEKPGAAGSAALRVLAMVRRLRQPDAAGMQDHARRSGNPPASGKIARVVVGCGQGRWLDREAREKFRNELRVMNYLDTESRVGRDLPVILVQHRGAVRAARNQLLHLGMG